MQTTHEFVDGDYNVLLEQRASGLFRVTYGAEIHDNLTYEKAAEQYGYFVFHSLAYAGKLSYDFKD